MRNSSGKFKVGGAALRILVAGCFGRFLFFASLASAASLPVTVVKAGAGTGSVKSTPAGIDCGATCVTNVAPASMILLTPTPDSGSVFDGWTSGPCLGIGACSFAVNAATTVTASFSKGLYTLSVTATGNYFGKIHITPLNKDVPGTCNYSHDGGVFDCNSVSRIPIPAGTMVTLDATKPDTNSYAIWSGWNGACSGMGPCTFVMNGDVAVSTGWDNARIAISVVKSGDGDGRIESDFENIYCGDVCTATFENGQNISLTANAFEGSIFEGWDNPNSPCTGFGQCFVRLDGHIPKPVTAHFQARKTGLELHKTGTGDGSITSQPPGATCTEGQHVNCQTSWNYGTQLTLTATPAKGSVFDSWDDPSCNGATCTMVLKEGRILTATFNSASGSGSGGCSVAGVGRGSQMPLTKAPLMLLLVGVALVLRLRRRGAAGRSGRLAIGACGLVGLCAVSACGPSNTSSDGGDISLPTIVGPDDNTPIIVHPGDPVTITVSLKNPDGSLSTNYIWGWSPLQLFDGEGFTSTIVNPEPAPRTGTESITVSWQAIGVYRVPGVVVAVGHTEISKSYNSPRIVVWGGPQAETVAATNAMPLLVGEKRTAMVIPTATVYPYKDSLPRRTDSHAPLAYSTRDATVATVDAHAVVTAVAVGKTTLDVQQGMDMAGRVSIPINVAAGVVGPPPLGVVLITGGPQLDPTKRTNVGIAAPVDMHLSIDSRGYPIGLVGLSTQFLEKQIGGVLIPATLASWSGSGLSLERINAGWFSMDDPRLAVDERDHIYVVGTGRISLDANLVIADRKESDGPASWNYRSPDFRLPEMVAAGLHVDAHFAPTARYAIVPHVGGGAWIASSLVWDRLDPMLVPGTKDCLEAVYLTEVTDAAVTTQIVRRVDFDLRDVSGNCFIPNNVSGLPFAIVPAAAGEDAPQVVIMEGAPTSSTDTRGVPTRWHKRAGAWSSEQVSLIGDSVYTIPGSVAGQPPLLLGHKANASNMNFADHPGITPQVVGNEAAAIQNHFGFQTRDFAYAGASRIGPLARVRFDRGDVQLDDGAFVFQSPNDPSEMKYISWSSDDLMDIAGVASDGKNLHFTVNLFYEMLKGIQLASLLTRPLPGPVAKTTDPESTGTLVAESTFTPTFTQRPLVLPDGTRYLLSEDTFLVDHTNATCLHAPGVLLKSAGPGMPLSQVTSRAASSLVGRIYTPLWGVAGHLYAFSQPINPFIDVRLARSTDGGVTWSAVASLPTTNLPYHQIVTASGEAWVVLPDFLGLDRSDAHLYHSTSVEGGAAFQQSFGLTAQLAPKGWVLRLTNQVAVVDAPDGVYELAIVVDAPTRQTAGLFVRHIVGGAIDYEKIVQPPILLDHVLRLGSAIVAPDGALVIQSEIANKSDIAILHLFPKTGVSAATVIPDPYNRDPYVSAAAPSLTVLADGRLVIAYATLVGNFKLGAVYRVSTDNGLTWGDVHLFRPSGGWGQLVPAIAAEPSGGFLALVGDNEALGASITGDQITSSYMCGMYSSYPPVRFSMQRVATP